MTTDGRYGPPGADDRERMIETHMPLVNFLVERMLSQVPSFATRDDLRSAAMLGLMDAASRFDPRRGVLFKTFAEQRIRGAIFDEVRRLDWFSRSLREKQSRLNKAVEDLERKLQRRPEEQEIAIELEISLDDFHELLTQVSHLGCVSLNESLDDSEGSASFIDNLEDTAQESVQERMEARELTQELAGHIAQLSDKEQLVLSLFYYEELSQKEIAEVLDLSEGRISQLHSQALLKMKVKMSRSIRGRGAKGGA
jgi:RNA polymerase sigma factor for flagellar operon FliA